MIGTYVAKIDDKGRLFVPSKLREELGEVFYVTVGVNNMRKCLAVYTKDGWDMVRAKYDALPLSQKGTLGLMFANAVECRPDKQYRFLVTPKLFRYAGIERDVTFVGQSGHAEIWNTDAYNQLEMDELTPEKLFAAMEVIGI